MKEFMLIFHGPDYAALGLSPEEIQLQMQKWFEWSAKLEQENKFNGGHALHAEGKILNKDGVITDGPFAESKELVGGYFIIKANNLDEALEISKDYPEFIHGGTVQVREVVVFDNEA
ncbi:MAG: hypothetical protein KTR13_03385 [Saprospiraceae bacterium]|nr:hypothetical protein [Saprospiraceae bacterium]